MNGKSLRNMSPEQKKARRREQMRKAEKKYEAKQKEITQLEHEVREQEKYIGSNWLHWSTCRHDVKYFMETRNLLDYYHNGITPDEAWGYFMRAKREEEKEYYDLLWNHPIIRYDRKSKLPLRFKNLEEATKDIKVETLNSENLPLYHTVWGIRDELVKLLKKSHTVKCGPYVFQFGAIEDILKFDEESDYITPLPVRKEN